MYYNGDVLAFHVQRQVILREPSVVVLDASVYRKRACDTFSVWKANMESPFPNCCLRLFEKSDRSHTAADLQASSLF